MSRETRAECSDERVSERASGETASRETLVLKLGGSVITEKDQPETVDEAALSRAAAAVAATDADVVVVHGGGSFGHHHADEHGVSTTSGTRDAAGALAIHEAMMALNRSVVAALSDAGVSALPVQPLSAAERDEQGSLSLAAGPVGRLLDEGFTPVVHGDVIAHAGEGVTVLSGDELVVELAPAVDADRVGLCSTVPGVLDQSGTVIDRVDSFDDVAAAVGESDTTDVSGGMAAKVQSLLGLAMPAQIFGPDALTEFLGGQQPGTTVATESECNLLSIQGPELLSKWVGESESRVSDVFQLVRSPRKRCVAAVLLRSPPQRIELIAIGPSLHEIWVVLLELFGDDRKVELVSVPCDDRPPRCGTSEPGHKRLQV